tara:strand:- start:196 stop:372 length:177 start_codon:yes stop_codon:yes gene_type:complete
MNKFYQKLIAGEGREDALAATQKEFRNQAIPSGRHPCFGRLFSSVVSGDLLILILESP